MSLSEQKATFVVPIINNIVGNDAKLVKFHIIDDEIHLIINDTNINKTIYECWVVKGERPKQIFFKYLKNK